MLRRLSLAAKVRTGPKFFVKVLVLFVLGSAAVLSTVIGVASIGAESQYEARRERFRREGTPVTEVVREKHRRRATNYLVFTPAETPPTTVGGARDRVWVQVPRTTYEGTWVGDSVELIRVENDYVVAGDDEPYQGFRPRESFIFGGVAAAAFLVVLFAWKTVEWPR
jgi:hypothetical protein